MARVPLSLLPPFGLPQSVCVALIQIERRITRYRSDRINTEIEEINELRKFICSRAATLCGLYVSLLPVRVPSPVTERCHRRDLVARDVKRLHPFGRLRRRRNAKHEVPFL